MFLVLSGILAGLGWAHKSENYFSYLFKKCLRIYPLYWMSVPLSIAAYVLGSWLLEGDFPKLFPNGVWLDVVGSITGAYSWMGLWGGPYNNPSWFIALIMSMYVFFPLVYRLLKIQPHIVILFFLALSVSARLYVGQNGVPFIDQSFYEGIKSYFYRQYGFMPGRPGDWFPLCRIFEFALGVYLAMVVPRKTWFFWSRGPQALIGFLSAQSFALFLIHYPYLFLLRLFNDWGWYITISITIYLLLMFVMAFYLNKWDAKFPRKRLMSKITGG